MPDRTYLTAVDLTDNPPPSFARLRSWRDQTAVHKSVMALFPNDLPGAPDERRASSRILYRTETVSGTPRVLIQSAIEPNAGVTKDITEFHNGVGHAARLLVRTQVNAVTNKSRSNRRVSVPADQIPDWFTARLNGAATAQVMDVRLNPLVVTHAGRESPLLTAVIDAACTVDDPEAFRRILREGFGRARAYGCGLVTAARL